MLSRSSAVIISLTSLSRGHRAGDRPGTRGPVVRPRLPARRTQTGAVAASPSPRRPASHQKQADDAIYDRLAKQYEQFQQVNRTFELVAKAVSPAVVHIVAAEDDPARETSRRPGSSRRPVRV